MDQNGYNTMYSRFDTYLIDNTTTPNPTNIIDWTIDYSAELNQNVTLSGISCGDLLFKGGTNISVPISDWTSGAFSHFDESCLTPSGDIPLMTPSLDLGEEKRYLTDEDVWVLIYLGYDCGGTFGNITGLPSGDVVPKGIVDGYGYPYASCSPSYSMEMCFPGDDIEIEFLANDINADNFIDLNLLQGIDAPTTYFNTFSQQWTLVLEPTVPGQVILRYIPILTNGLWGNATCIYIQVNSCNSQCLVPDDCNLICNPDFDDPNIAPAHLGWNYMPQNWTSSHGTPDNFYESNTSFSPRTISMFSQATQNTQNNEGIKTPVDIDDQNKYILSYFRMCLPVPSNSTYNYVEHLKFKLVKTSTALTSLNSLIAHVLPEVLSSDYQLIVQEDFIPVYGDWEQVTVCFTAEDEWDYLWIHPENNSPAINGRIFIDNVEIIPFDEFFAGDDINSDCGIVSFGQNNCTVENMQFECVIDNTVMYSNTGVFTANVQNTTTFTITATFPPFPSNPQTVVTPVQNVFTFTDDVVVTINNSLSATTSSLPDDCGSCDGSATVNVTTGNSPLYIWDNSDTGPTSTNLCVGSYTVTVSDANNCQGVFTVDVLDSNGPVITSNITNTCFNTSNGAIDISITTGTSPYTIAWNNGSAFEDQSGLTDGTYEVTVTDALGCSTIESFEVIALSESLQVNETIINTFCYDSNDGIIQTSPDGGALPYSYIWNTNSIDQNIGGLDNGIYYLTLSDANNCSISESFTIESPTEISIISNMYPHPTCGGQYGQIWVSSVFGGTPGYSYNWSDGDTGSLNGYNSAGLYVLTLTDANGCDYVESFTLNDPSDVILSNAITVTDECLLAGASAEINTNLIIGNPPYTFEWSTSPIQSTNPVTGLVSGIYDVTVTGSDNCTGTESFTVSCLTLDTRNTPSCGQLCTGELDIETIDNSLTGLPAATPISYSWSTGGTTAQISNLCAGFYTVTVTDDDGNIGINTYEIVEYTVSPQITSQTNASCPLVCDGDVEITLSGNMPPPLDFYWEISSQQPFYDDGSGTSTSYTFDLLCANEYNITVTDDYGCVGTLNGIIIESNFYLDYDITPVSCLGSTLVDIDITVAGGSPPYISYAWSNLANTEDLTSVASSTTYTVTVIDNAGCVLESDIEVPLVSNLMTISTLGTQTQPTCPYPPNGNIEAIITGGVAPYTFAWSTSPIQTTSTLNDVGPGTYWVTVTDYYGCEAVNSSDLGSNYLMDFTVDLTQPTCPVANDGSFLITMISGSPPYTFQWNKDGFPYSTDQDLTGLLNGSIYGLTMTSTIDNCQLTYSELMSDGVLQVEVNVIGEGCDITGTQALLGSATATVTGGVPPYSYLWNGNSNLTTSAITDLTDGSVFTVEVDDNSGCSGTATVTIGSDQIIDLPEGWSMFSTYIDPFTVSQNNYVEDYFFSQGIISEVIQIKATDGLIYYSPTQTTFFSTFEIGEGYYIKMASHQEFYLEGNLLCPEDNALVLPINWRQIGYLRTTPRPVNLEFTMPEMILIKTETGNLYWPLYYYNSIGDLYPGEGYQIKMSSQVTSFYYSANSTATGTKTFNQIEDDVFTHFVDETNMFTNNFMVLMIPLNAFQEPPSYGSEIGIFSTSNQLVGRAIFRDGNTGFVIYGDDSTTVEIDGLVINEPFSIQVWDGNSKTNKLYKVSEWVEGNDKYENGKISVAANTIDPLNENPSIDDLFVEISPNPGSGNFNCQINSQLIDNCFVEIYNINSTLVFKKNIELCLGRNDLKLNLTKLSSGTYAVRIVTKQTVFNKKLQIVK